MEKIFYPCREEYQALEDFIISSAEELSSPHVILKGLEQYDSKDYATWPKVTYSECRESSYAPIDHKHTLKGCLP
jgi:hypothetical protein